MPFVGAEHIVKTYLDGERQHTVLQDVTFSLERGELVALTGSSGSGKSTLLNLLSGLDVPTSGTIRIDGVEITGQTDAWLTEFRRDHIGIIYQFFNLIPLLTVRENLSLIQLLNGKEGDCTKFSDVVRKLQIEDILNEFPAKLSGGQQQRVAVGRAILMHPSLILADEPTGSLDGANGNAVMDLLENLCRDYGQTTLVVTHDPDIAARCDRILYMKDGRVLEGGARGQ